MPTLVKLADITVNVPPQAAGGPLSLDLCIAAGSLISHMAAVDKGSKVGGWVEPAERSSLNRRQDGGVVGRGRGCAAQAACHCTALVGFGDCRDTIGVSGGVVPPGVHLCHLLHNHRPLATTLSLLATRPRSCGRG